MDDARVRAVFLDFDVFDLEFGTETILSGKPHCGQMKDIAVVG